MMKVGENLFLPTSLHVDVFNGAGNSEDESEACPVWTADHGFMMAIRTREEGLNMGRAYLCHFEAHLELEAWMAHIQQNQVQAEREEGMSKRVCVRGVERESELDKKKLQPSPTVPWGTRHLLLCTCVHGSDRKPNTNQHPECRTRCRKINAGPAEEADKSVLLP